MATADFDYDVFCIGAGSGGVRAARISSNYGEQPHAVRTHAMAGGGIAFSCVRAVGMNCMPCMVAACACGTFRSSKVSSCMQYMQHAVHAMP
eukprot:365965-Chlamydomonas_euryale.AAC.3